jgi:small subunit ribosomal protein S7
MPRRAHVLKREVVPDPRFGSRTLTRFINKVMLNGKKSTAERIVYGALDTIERQARRSPIDVFDVALRNATPLLEVKPRRVGGATYQVPVEIKGDRKTSLAMRWLIAASRSRSGHSMLEKLAAELMDASNNTGATIRKRDETHRMAEANKAFSHYRW